MQGHGQQEGRGRLPVYALAYALELSLCRVSSRYYMYTSKVNVPTTLSLSGWTGDVNLTSLWQEYLSQESNPPTVRSLQKWYSKGSKLARLAAGGEQDITGLCRSLLTDHVLAQVQFTCCSGWRTPTCTHHSCKQTVISPLMQQIYYAPQIMVRMEVHHKGNNSLNPTNDRDSSRATSSTYNHSNNAVSCRTYTLQDGRSLPLRIAQLLGHSL